MILTDVLESYGSLVDYCDAFNQLFKLSVWRHPFTAEDPLVDLFWNSSTICMTSGWVNPANFQMSAYVNKTLYNCKKLELHNQTESSFGPDPAHIWPAWILHGPDVGRIWANTMLLSGYLFHCHSKEIYDTWRKLSARIPIHPNDCLDTSQRNPFISTEYYLLSYMKPLYILEEKTISDMMKLDSYSSKLQNGHKQP